MPGLNALFGSSGARQLTARFRIAADEYVSGLALCRGSTAVAGLGDGTLLGFGLSDGRQLYRIQAHRDAVLDVALSPDGVQLVSCGHEPVARLWRATGELLRELPGGSQAPVEHVAWSADGDKLATAAGRAVRVWTRGGEPLLETELPSSATGLSFRFDGHALAASCYGGAHILPLARAIAARHLAWKGSLISVAWSPDGKVIACGTQQSSVLFWRLSSGSPSEMTGYPRKPRALAWDEESGLLATGGDATVTTWDFRGKGPEGRKPRQLSGHELPCTRLAFAPRRALLASGGKDGRVLVWKPRVGGTPLAAAELGAEISALGWQPGAAVLVGADAAGSVAAWQQP